MLNLGFKTSYGRMIVGKIIGWNFLTTNSTNFHEWGAASRENFIVGFIRVHSEYSWFIFSLQPGSARSLLKWEELTLCVLGVFGGQNAFGSSAVIDIRYNVSEPKIFRNLLEACAASAYASLHHDCPSLEPHAE